ncbi:diguanylate cyclase domain-containing protein [Rhizobacter fulvus]
MRWCATCPSRSSRAPRANPLTGLLDRYAFQHRLQQAIDERRQGALGVVTLDLNRFKEVNESLGHAAGDTILRALAEVDAALRQRRIHRPPGRRPDRAVCLAARARERDRNAVRRP